MLGMAQCGGGRGNAVVFTDAKENGAADVAGSWAGTCNGDGQGGTCRHVVPVVLLREPGLAEQGEDAVDIFGAGPNPISPGLAAPLTLTGGRRSSTDARSRSAAVNRRATVRGEFARAEARPSVNGHCTIAAVTPGVLAAVTMTWPPANDVPHSTSWLPSTSGSVRAYETAAFQS
jgi:hypothetical protein